jgi:hypothetical protein
MPEKHLNPRFLKSGRISFAAAKENGSRVNFESRTITDVIMCQVGEAKGHGVHLEQSFIEAGIAYANKHHASIGLKCRFGHPAMSNDALGTEVGRFKNFRVVDDKMVADLHIYQSANLSPTHPGAGDWILSMAEEDPNAIMCSIVFVPGEEYQYDEEGNKFYIAQNKKKYNPENKVYTELQELWATDLVDDGAATDKLFSAIANPDKFAVVATQFLDEHPKIAEFLMQKPEKLQEFLNTYQGLKNQFQTNNSKQMKIKFLSAWAFALSLFGLADKKEDELPDVTAEHFGKLNDECTRLSSELAQKTKDNEALQAQVDALGTDKTTLSGRITELQGQLADEKKQKEAYSALAEKYRAAAGEAFKDTKPDKPDALSPDNGGEKEKKFTDYGVNQRALDEIKNI